MRELRFEGLSDDGTRLVLVGKDGQRWSVVIDERVEAAVRRDRARLNQVELEQAGELRPREIQARIRAGATAEDVAAASGLPLERIRRFEGPVLTKRAWIAQQAGKVQMRRPNGDISLAELVTARLGDQGVAPEDITWDSWQPEDGPWTVIATFPLGPNTHVATWLYDSGMRTVTPVDDNAEDLSAAAAPAKLRLVAPRPQLAAVAGASGERHDLPEHEDAQIPAPPQVGSDDADNDSSDPADHGHDGNSPAGRDGTAAATALPAESIDAKPEDLDPEPPASPISGVAPIEQGVRPTGRSVRRAGKRVTRHPSGSALPAQPAEPSAATTDADSAMFDAEPEGAAKPKTGRSAVPSFDDILFGPAPKH
jgi:hypothetical protein